MADLDSAAGGASEWYCHGAIVTSPGPAMSRLVVSLKNSLESSLCMYRHFMLTEDKTTCCVGSQKKELEFPQKHCEEFLFFIVKDKPRTVRSFELEIPWKQ